MIYTHFLTYNKIDYLNYIFLKLYLLNATLIKILLLFVINSNKYFKSFLYYFIVVLASCYVMAVYANLWTETARMSDLQQVCFKFLI